MGKLVLYLADGTLLHVPLDKERITIGRRADNDVCLPYPAVSGEHAAVVTILADSFLEDQGSTNGTLVNGKPVGKHFLNDRDQVDIGRQRLVYLADDDAQVDPLPPDMVRNQLRGLSDRVEPARAVSQIPMPTINIGRSFAPSVPSALTEEFDREIADPARAAAEAAAPIPVRKGELAMSGAVPAAENPSVPNTVVVGRSAARVAPPVPAKEHTTPRDTFTANAPMRPVPPRAIPDVMSRTMQLNKPNGAQASAPDGTPAPRVPSVRVLSGPSTGRSVPFPNDQLSVGRVGIQVAIVRKVPDGYRLVPVEGADMPRINGAPVAAEGSPLHPGDTFEVAGVRLELSVNP